jgi:hypothetical protein
VAAARKELPKIKKFLQLSQPSAVIVVRTFWFRSNRFVLADLGPVPCALQSLIFMWLSCGQRNRHQCLMFNSPTIIYNAAEYIHLVFMLHVHEVQILNPTTFICIIVLFVETPRKFITVKLSIRKPGSSSVLIICIIYI